MNDHSPTEAWHDPTHGRIDRDIQHEVDKMNPDSVGQRCAIENTLQAKRCKMSTDCPSGVHKIGCPKPGIDAERFADLYLNAEPIGFSDAAFGHPYIGLPDDRAFAEWQLARGALLSPLDALPFGRIEFEPLPEIETTPTEDLETIEITESLSRLHAVLLAAIAIACSAAAAALWRIADILTETGLR